MKAIELEYKGVNNENIAKTLGISLNTLSKWQNDTDYKQASVSLATSQLGTLVPLAISNLRSILEDETTSATVRLQASTKVLEMARIDERSELEKEINIKVEYV